MTPRTEVEVSGNRGSVTATAIIDTGFEGDVCLPIDLAVTLGLELWGVTDFELADGTVKRELLFDGTARLLAQSRSVLIALTNSEDALIGTNLMNDCQLFIDFGAGQVKLSRKPPQRKGRAK